MSQITEAVMSIAALIVGLAILSVLVSGKSKTADVISATSAAFANSLSAATAPVTGNAATPVVSTGGFGGFSNFQLPSFG
jgi:hypothetical protein